MSSNPVTEDKEFRYATHQDPNRRLSTGGVYLDDELRREAEIQRARIEGREPDLDNPPAMQSTPLFTKNQISHAANPVAITTDPDVVLPVAVGRNDSDGDDNDSDGNDSDGDDNDSDDSDGDDNDSDDSDETPTVTVNASNTSY